jgi:RsmE family RNA methyltransferase
VNIILFEEHELGRTLPRRDERTKHLLKVLHKKCGDTFEAGIIGGLRGTGKIEKINFDGSIFVTIEATRQPPPRLRLRMAVAFARPIQMRRIFRELSSLGAAAIDVMGADLGEKSYRDAKLFTDGGAYASLVEGAAQSRDTNLPSLTVFESLDKWLEERPWEKGSIRVPLLLAMDNVRPEGSLFRITQTSRPAIVAVGPERGWSDRERELFEKAGFLRLSMGSRALRTETACVAAAALAIEKSETDL